MVTNQSGTVTSHTVVVGTTMTAFRQCGHKCGAGATQPFQPPNPAWQTAMAVATALAAALSTAANLLALCWFGMWMGMTSRSANLATLKTILFVEIIPWFVIALREAW